MNPLPLLAILCSLLVCTTLFTACAKEQKVEKPPEKSAVSTQPRIVGRVASISEERKFVLIQSYGTWNVPTGSVLTSRGPDGRSANLRVTGEKLGQYAAADIRSGTLEVGDGVQTVATLSKPPGVSGSEEAAPMDAPEDTQSQPGPEKPAGF